jgi:flagellar hook-associated protein 1 FlgK
MSLNAALAVATGGLANINRQLALISQNVANASTPGYAVETASQQSLTAGGVGMGVMSGLTTLNVNTQVQASLLLQNAAVGALTTRQTALAAIDAAQGAPGQGSDLPSLLGKLQDAFSTLAGSPDSQPQQDAVIGAARTLASGINALSSAYVTQRQAAQDSIASEVGTLNTTLSTIGSLSDQIVAMKATGQSTADLENQRNAAVQGLSQLVDVKALPQPTGDLILTTTNGLLLPIHGQANPFSAPSAMLGPGAYYPGGGIPAITLDGMDVTAHFTSGQIGANITLRDTTLPTDQSELDEFSQNLAGRFSAQGLNLFTDINGNVPAGGGSPAQSGYVGFAGDIQVNPAVRANPALVRDGTQAVAGSPTGASAFTPNPAGGPAGFATLISRVLDYTFGADAQSGVAQPATNTAGLGPTGMLNAPYAAPATLSGIASALVAAQAQDSSTTSTQTSTEQSVQTSLQSTLSAGSAVNMDTEMSLMITLQNAYGANAKIITAAQAMFTQLLQSVT